MQRSSHDILSNRAGLAPNKKDKVSLKACCKYPFYQLNITANGNVGICCLDVYVEYPLGNVNRQTLKEIWGGDIYIKFRQMLLKGDRSLFKMCQGCDFRGYTALPKKYRRFGRILDKFARVLHPGVKG